MKKFYVLFVVSIGILIAGCSNDEPEKDPDDIVAIGEEKDDIEEKQKEGSSQRPPKLSLHAGDQTENFKNHAYCWDKSDCSHIKKKEPQEIETLLKDEESDLFDMFSVGLGKRVRINVSGDSIDNAIMPDTIEGIAFNDEHQIELDITTNYMTVPEEKGTYYVDVHATWEKEIKGEAYYAIQIKVR